MSADFLTTESVMECPHGGTVNASTSNTRVKARGAFVLRGTDQFLVSGCTHMIGTVLHQCVRVRWDVTAMHHSSHGARSLTTESVGICVAADGGEQGQVSISSTQDKAAGS